VSENKNDILQFISEDSETNGLTSYKKPWKIIVADDDEEVHAVTVLALSNFQFKGRPLNILSAYSSTETEKLIQENPDTAVILLDVVMENHDSGLELVHYIRKTVENNLVRIILRTGQPGYAPELQVILNYDINDYKEKTELTSSKLVTTLVASLRNFDDLQRIEQNRKSLEIVAASSAKMHGLKHKDAFGEYMITSLAEVLNSFSPDCDPFLYHGILIRNEDKEPVAIVDEEGNSTSEEIDEKVFDLLNSTNRRIRLSDSTEESHIIHKERTALLHYKSAGKNERVVLIQCLPELNDIQKSILLTFASHITTVLNNIELMEEQLRIENEIRKSLDEKLILVKEIHHRVKNNLQIISSLLHMQSIGVKDPILLDVLKESENRVQSMSLVHEKLYQSDLMATIDFNEYISSLAERLIQTYSVQSDIELEIDAEPLMLSINTAIPCGLIVNEILTNSIKYAFPGNRYGKILIKMKVSENDVELTISDNGVGLPVDFDPSKVKSLGMKLIRVLTDQIDGELEVDRKGGTSYKLFFSESAQRES